MVTQVLLEGVVCTEAEVVLVLWKWGLQEAGKIDLTMHMDWR